MFLRTNDRVVNLQNVSNINIIQDEKRIAFNMNYYIEIKSKGRIIKISDYAYWDAVNDTNFKENIRIIKDDNFLQENFIKYFDGNGLINIYEISSVKFSEKKNRVIFNLSHPVTFTDFHGQDKITSEFVFIDCNSIDEFKEYSAYVSDILFRR